MKTKRVVIDLPCEACCKDACGPDDVLCVRCREDVRRKKSIAQSIAKAQAEAAEEQKVKNFYALAFGGRR